MNEQMLEDIANRLAPKYRSYLLGKSKGTNLKAAEKAVLDQVKNDAFVRFQTVETVVARIEDGIRASQNGVTPSTTTTTQPTSQAGTPPPAAQYESSRAPGEGSAQSTRTFTPTSSASAPTQVTTSRVPGEGSRRGGDLTVMPATGTSGATSVQKNKYVDAVIDLMGDDFRNWYLNGDMTSLTASERTRIGQAMKDPNNIDFEVLAEFADVGDQTFFPAAIRAVVEIDLAAGDAAAAAQQTRAQNEAADAETMFPYYNPRTSQIEYLTDAQAKAQGLQPPTAAQRRVGAIPTPSVPPAATPSTPSAATPSTPSAATPSTPSAAAKPPASATKPRVDTSTLTGVTAASGQQPSTSTGIPGVDTFDPTQGVSREQIAGGLLPGISTKATGGGGGVPVGDGDDDPGGDGGGGGGGVVIMPATEQVDPAIPQSWEEAAAQIYPEYYAILRNNPEIADLLRRSIGADGQPAWSEAKFQAELAATNWYKTTSASARVWDTKSALDPATYQAMVDEAAAAINAEALNYGIRLSSEQLQKLALESQRLGFGREKITNAIGMLAVAGGSAGATQLREGFYGQQVRNVAADYGITLNDTTFNQFVNKIAVGEESLSSFQDYALTIAKAMFPSVSEQFDAGLTFSDITAPFKTIASNLLEIEEVNIDFRQPQWAQALTYQPDPKTGEQRLMNMREWQDYLRNTDSFGYQYTTEARSRAYGVADTLANMFGRI